MSRFVSGGTIDQPVERDDEWLKAQQELENERRSRVEASQQEGGKSLYEVLQANKAKKQEAFEESIKLKNQFRALDEDEAEFLDSVLESTRAKEAALKKETTQQLDAFRKQQDEAERAARLTGNTEGDAPAEEEHWASAGRKRKKGKEKESLKGFKIRRKSTADEKEPSSTATKPAVKDPAAGKAKEMPGSSDNSTSQPVKVSPASGSSPPKHDAAVVRSPTQKEAQADKPKPIPAALGLAGYSSDEDD